MAYVALYRSYRPKQFQEVVGQKHVIQTLKHAVVEKKTSHAYIFSGLRGIGKTTIARILAKAVNCENTIDGEPCNACRNCLAIARDETTDIVELDAASNNGVDEMREILEKVNFLPSMLRKKVYIIDEAHMLSTAAFNALLKTLEEPPLHVMFILATTEPHKIPQTILSRCQRFDFKQLSNLEIEHNLKSVCEKEHIEIEDDALRAIAESAEGGMRDALGILDQANVYSNGVIKVEDVSSVTGKISTHKLIELMDALKEKNASLSIGIINELIDSGKEVSRVVGGAIQFCRDTLLYKNISGVDQTKNIYNYDAFITFATKISEKELFYYIDVFVDIQNKIRFTNSQKIYLEVGILKIINSAEEDIDILGKIQKLESAIGENHSGGYYASQDYDTRINNIDAKIKKVTMELEKADLVNFKEKMESKMDMIEEVSSKNSLLPGDLTIRLDELEDKIRLLDASSNEKEIKDIDEIKNKIQEITKQMVEIHVEDQDQENKDASLEQVNTQIQVLEQKIQIIEEKIKNEYEKQSSDLTENIPDLTPVIEQMQALTEKVNHLEKAKEDIGPVHHTTDLEERLQVLEEYVELITESSATQPDPIVTPSILENSEMMQEVAELKDNYFTIIKALQEFHQNKDENAIVELESKLQAMEEKVSGMLKQAEELSNQIVLLQTTDQEQNEKLQVVQSKLKTLETKPTKPVVEAPIQTKVQTETYVRPVEEPKVVETNESKTIQTIKNVYDVRIIERILHEARGQECREEKGRLIAGWNRLADKVGFVLEPVAKILLDGKLVANGQRELIVVYPTAMICNHLMEPKNHVDAKQVLRIAFGKDYDFLALPENTWQEKRSEYVGQVGVGIRYPKLTPIHNPELKVVVVNYDQVNKGQNDTIHQAQRFFGKAKVEEER
ncbi:MAG: DNA polymerase III subunit gamma/tau [Prevotella sp.]|nr:DNA polymerase III subunit gamma/tau [Staphylococcus sp.]MCM1350891.1 DNA polymerase III subunit gamma/tau [Prevotella sp.]